MSEWKPIESAPKDGTRVLVTDGVETEVADWYVRPYPDRYIERPDGLFEKAPTEFAQGYWNCNDCQKPTHWMPLPLPPLGEKDDN